MKIYMRVVVLMISLMIKSNNMSLIAYDKSNNMSLVV